jgi:polyphenol oxidase
VSTGGFSSLNLGLHVGDDDQAVLENRNRVAEAFGAAPDEFVFCEQVHRPAVAVVTAAHRGAGARSLQDALAATDALVTATPGVVLTVMVADCVPVVLYDPVQHVLACVHAGWGGTVRGVTTAAVETMGRLGSDPVDIVAGIGPSIAPERYQVGPDVARAAAAELGPDTERVLHPDGAGRWTFDLWRANMIQLQRAGLPARSTHLAGLGTGPGTPFFSHRFEGPCGRFAAIARLRPR